MTERIIFYILAFIMIVFSLMSVTSTKIIRSAIYLLGVLMATAGLYFLFNLNFLGAIQLTVYAGGIMVLIVIAILLTHHVGFGLPVPDKKHMILGWLAAMIGITISFFQFTTHTFKPKIGNLDDRVSKMGADMLHYGDGGFVLPFEVISILLLAGIIAAITIAKGGIPHLKKRLKSGQPTTVSSSTKKQ